MKGTVVCNEHILPIVDIGLRDGKFVLTIRAVAHDTRTYDLRGEMRCFAADGTEVFHLPNFQTVDDRYEYTITAGGTLDFELPLQFTALNWHTPKRYPQLDKP